MRAYPTSNAWKERLVRLIERGVPETAALNASGVGRAKMNEEMRRDDEFARRIEAARQAV